MLYGHKIFNAWYLLKAKASDFHPFFPPIFIFISFRYFVPMAWHFGITALLSFAAAVSPVQDAMDAMDAVDVMSLTVAMVTDVDGQVLDLRSSRAERQLLRLGNTGKVAKDVTWKHMVIYGTVIYGNAW